MQSKTYNISFNTNYLEHIGNKNSGRYPRGSGENPYQHDKSRHGALKAGLIGAGISAANVAARYPGISKATKSVLERKNDFIKEQNEFTKGWNDMDKDFGGHDQKSYEKLIDIPAFMRNFKIGYIVGGGLGALAWAGISVASNYGSKKIFNVMINSKLKKTKIKDVEGFKQRMQSNTANRRAALSSLGVLGLGINAMVDDVRLDKELKNYDKINQKTGKLKNKYKPHNY